MKRLKKKWDIKSDFQLIVIIIVFSITGSLSAIISEPLLNFIGLNKNSYSSYIYWPARIIIIFPIYQILIIIIGSLFGQHKFFWNFCKEMMVRLKLIKD